MTRYFMEIPNEKENKFAENMLDAILQDDDTKFLELLSTKEDDPNCKFKITTYKIPALLQDCPSYCCVCCFFGAEKCFEVLANISSNIDWCDYSFRSPIHFAAAGGNMNIIRSIESKLGLSESLDKRNLSPQQYAAWFGHLDVVKYFYTKGFKMDQQVGGTLSPLKSAAQNGYLDVVKFLLDVDLKSPKEFQENNKQLNSLHCACENGHLPVVQYLVKEKHYNVNMIDSTNKNPLYYACQNGSIECVKFLIDSGAVYSAVPCKSFFINPLIPAIENGFVDVSKYLIQLPEISYHEKDQRGETALTIAIHTLRKEIIDILFSNNVLDNLDDESYIGDIFWGFFIFGNIQLLHYLETKMTIPYDQLFYSNTIKLSLAMEIQFDELTWGDVFMQQASLFEWIELIEYFLSIGLNFNRVCLMKNITSKIFMKWLTEQKGVDLSTLESTGKTFHYYLNNPTSSNIVNLFTFIQYGAKLTNEIIENYDLFTKILFNRFEFQYKLRLLELAVLAKPSGSNIAQALKYIKNRLMGDLTEFQMNTVKSIHEKCLEYLKECTDEKMFKDIIYFSLEYDEDIIDDVIPICKKACGNKLAIKLISCEYPAVFLKLYQNGIRFKVVSPTDTFEFLIAFLSFVNENKSFLKVNHENKFDQIEQALIMFFGYASGEIISSVNRNSNFLNMDRKSHGNLIDLFLFLKFFKLLLFVYERVGEILYPLEMSEPEFYESIKKSGHHKLIKYVDRYHHKNKVGDGFGNDAKFYNSDISDE
ncbi:hypothetical protein TRFO_23161 [Tritrichomonas foetus]|uniref:Uncharacterized protein n=1 Tax=Tritrichomonas foetus TaxID=1144522 RepID=A0A1J4KBU6_9EUKA|nr:hypothetical protein TRFO_23161 [Tritrichomonas foetus]|eukprot:OHT08392.1 hypothetical protein TRFO_23161 [Tritrichomonas foetus]